MDRRQGCALGVMTLAVIAWAGCSDSRGEASARRVSSRIELVGGDRSLGDVGDYLLENERIRIVVQGPGFSRGFGVYGGSLIDADLRRPFETGTSGQPVRNDQFGELFPAFFVQAVNVNWVFVDNDGGSARAIAAGEAGDFLELSPASITSRPPRSPGRPGGRCGRRGRSSGC